MSAPDALTPPQLRVRSLTVRRGERTLVSGLDLHLSGGGVLLLRGPNGAGKSSLLLAIAGVLRADHGSVEYRDRGRAEPVAEAAHLVSHRSAVKAALSVRENLAFWRAVNGGTGQSVEAALETLGIGPLADLRAGYLSAGQTRRLALARLLVSRRPLWLLDEPTAALDAAGERLVGSLVRDHAAAGGMVVMATHQDLAAGPDFAVETHVLGGGA